MSRAIDEYVSEQERRHGAPVRMAADDPRLLVCPDCGAVVYYGPGKHGCTLYETVAIGIAAEGRRYCSRKTKHFPNNCDFKAWLARQAKKG